MIGAKEKKIVFWGLMILKVDRLRDDKLSLILEIAKLLHITDIQLIDMVHAIKVVLGEKDDAYELQEWFHLSIPLKDVCKHFKSIYAKTGKSVLSII